MRTRFFDKDEEEDEEDSIWYRIDLRTIMTCSRSDHQLLELLAMHLKHQGAEQAYSRTRRAPRQAMHAKYD